MGPFKDDSNYDDDSDFEDGDPENEVENGDDNGEPTLPEKIVTVPIGNVAYKTYGICFCYLLLLVHTCTTTKMEGDDFLSLYRQHSIQIPC